jgi:hypothetical protein
MPEQYAIPVHTNPPDIGKIGRELAEKGEVHLTDKVFPRADAIRLIDGVLVSTEKEEPPPYKQVNIVEDHEKKRRIYNLPIKVKKKGYLKVDNNIIKNSKCDLKEILKREATSFKKRTERELPKVKIAHSPPLTLPTCIQNELASIGLPEEAPMHFTQEIPEIDDSKVKIRPVSGTGNTIEENKITDILNKHRFEPITLETVRKIETDITANIGTTVRLDSVTTSTGLNPWLQRTVNPDYPITTNGTGSNLIHIDYTNPEDIYTGAAQATTRLTYINDYVTFEISIDATGVNVVLPEYSSFDKESHVRHVIKEHMKHNLLIKIGKCSYNRQTLPIKATPAETKARGTLRDMITEAEWRRYVTNGFIMVRGPSGFWYQVFNNGSNTNVYKDGKKVNSICIHTVRDCPPTDHVINLKILVELDESKVWRGGNVHNWSSVNTKKAPQPTMIKENLVDIWKRYKTA